MVALAYLLSEISILFSKDLESSWEWGKFSIGERIDFSASLAKLGMKLSDAQRALSVISID